MHRHYIQSGCIILTLCLQCPASGSAAYNDGVCSRQQKHVVGGLSASSNLNSKVHQKSLCSGMQNAMKWDQVHVIGHSMGAMVATQLACMHPDRLLSLTLISVTAGRWQSIPTNWAAIKYAWQVSSSALFSAPALCATTMQLGTSIDKRTSMHKPAAMFTRLLQQAACIGMQAVQYAHQLFACALIDSSPI